jgi:hypothetical protein
MSEATSGQTYLVRRLGEMDDFFLTISREIQNSYFLTYALPSTTEKKWRTIEVSVKGMKGLRIHAREGYFPN